MKPFLIELPQFVDDRGVVHGIIDEMDALTYKVGEEYIAVPTITRSYVVRNWQVGYIRAFHGHTHAWTGLHVVSGATKIVCKPILKDRAACADEVVSTTLAACKPSIYWVPPGWYNGAMSLSSDTILVVFSTLSMSSVKALGDDVRLPFTDTDLHFFNVVPR
jgi:dTDP-4-dehydrorhamnose 3,5-epimerase-like enzyme